MSEGRNTELVSELRACATGKTEENPYQMLDRAAAALESTSRALSEKEGELAALRSDEAFCCDAVIDQTASEIAGLVGPNDEAQAVEASVKRALVFMRSLANLRLTEALAALKASEERGLALREALEPFAAASKRFDDAAAKFEAMPRPDNYCPVTKFTHGELRRARSALENGPATLADATKKDPGTEQREAGRGRTSSEA